MCTTIPQLPVVLYCDYPREERGTVGINVYDVNILDYIQLWKTTCLMNRPVAWKVALVISCSFQALHYFRHNAVHVNSHTFELFLCYVQVHYTWTNTLHRTEVVKYHIGKLIRTLINFSADLCGGIFNWPLLTHKFCTHADVQCRSYADSSIISYCMLDALRWHMMKESLEGHNYTVQYIRLAISCRVVPLTHLTDSVITKVKWICDVYPPHPQ